MGNRPVKVATSKYQKQNAPSSYIPERQEILDAVQKSGGVINTRDLARTFDLKGASRKQLKTMLKSMIEDGQLQHGHNRRHFRMPSTMPPIGVVEISNIDADGELVGRPISWKFHDNSSHITVTMARRSPLRAPRVGERVLVRLKAVDQYHIEARIMRHLGKGVDRIIGVIEKNSAGTRIRAISRQAPKQILLNSETTEHVESGDVVMATINSQKTYGPLTADIKERLGRFDSPGGIESVICAQFDIPSKFSTETYLLAENAGPPDSKGRIDLQSVPLVTIDDEDARDFDDAVWASKDLDPDNRGGWHLIVAIADVAAYVKTGDALDKEAGRRGNSVYLPNMVIPMLPKPLSNGWCSLNPGETRACIAVHLWIDKNGRILHHRFERALMRSAGRLTYTSVQKAYEGDSDEITAPLMTQIKNLYGAYAALKEERSRRNTLDFDLPERKITFDETNRILDITNRPRFDSHRLIEEFMIAANVSAAQVLAGLNAPCMYRIHDQPPLDKLEALRGYLKGVGYKLSKSQRFTSENFQQILNKSKGTEQEEAIATIILRTQSQAEYSPENIGHFGLNLNLYAHFTSPIRRYSDLLVHRSLICSLQLGEDGLLPQEFDNFPQIGNEISATERRAARAERQALDRYMVIYMSDKKGAEFGAKVAGVTRFGLFVTVNGIGAEGLVPMRVLSNQLGERVSYDADKQVLTARRARTSFSLSQTISVRLDEANMITGQLSFSLAAFPSPGFDGTARPPKRRNRQRQ